MEKNEQPTAPINMDAVGQLLNPGDAVAFGVSKNTVTGQNGLTVGVVREIRSIDRLAVSRSDSSTTRPSILHGGSKVVRLADDFSVEASKLSRIFVVPSKGHFDALGSPLEVGDWIAFNVSGSGPGSGGAALYDTPGMHIGRVTYLTELSVRMERLTMPEKEALHRLKNPEPGKKYYFSTRKRHVVKLPPLDHFPADMPISWVREMLGVGVYGSQDLDFFKI
jgi:hypothetical protein